MQADFDYGLLNEDGKLSYDMWSYSLDRAEAAVPFQTTWLYFWARRSTCFATEFPD